MSFAVIWGHEQTVPTNLCNGHQIWHPLKIVGCEIDITSRLDFHQIVVDLGTEFVLAIPVLGQIPEPKGQLEKS